MPALGLVLLALQAAPAAGVAAPSAAKEVLQPDRLSGWEVRAGWRLLFDGASTAGWLGAQPGPRVADGWLTASVPGTELVLAERVGNFELELRARSSSDASVPEAVVRVIAHWPRLEVWDGARHHEPVVVPTDTEVKVGPIAVRCPMVGLGPCELALVPSESRDAFRDIRVRALDELPGTRVELCDGRTLAGWRKIGDAQWSVEDGAIVGTIGGGAQSFLVTEKEYGDFILDVDLKNEQPGNSGIQVRSHQSEKGRVFGYQIEIDPSARAWSGGFYDEGRRGWLDDLADDPLARAAFKPGEWNHYRIECVGPHVKTWVNGVKCVDALDPLDAEGFIGLQVHSGKDTKVRWKNFVLHDLGSSPWKPLAMAIAKARVPGEPIVEGGSTGQWRSTEPFVDIVLRAEHLKKDGWGYGLRLHVPPSGTDGGDWWEIRSEWLFEDSAGWTLPIPGGAAASWDGGTAAGIFVVLAGSRLRMLHPVRTHSHRIDPHLPSSGFIELSSTPGAPGPQGDLRLEVRTPSTH